LRTPLIAGNWKMYMTRPQARGLVQGLKEALSGQTPQAQVVLAPPYTALGDVAEALKDTGWYLAAQNVHWEEEGPYTGEVSPVMLREVGCSFVILGHSERRQYFGETDQVVQKKLRAALRHGLTPILCVGESLGQRERGQTVDVVEGQLAGALDGLPEHETPEFVIAYEPIWAIGTGKTATPDQAQEVHLAIRRWLERALSPRRAVSTRVLYGGSVKADNIDRLMAEPDIDGALVGGASLKADSFARIVAFRSNA
jgi:triosephosphate isomerase